MTSTDLMRLEHANPIYLVGDLRKAAGVEDVVRLTRRLPRIVQQLTEEAASADDIGRVATAVSDATARRLLDLAIAELGPPPAPYCWVVLGSQARLEQGLAGDQDNALILGDQAAAGDEEYFATLAQRVSDGLAACGYAYCTGGVMATNPTWRQPLTQWRRTFSAWLKTPEPDAVLSGSIFFDMRPLHGPRAVHRAAGPGAGAGAPPAHVPGPPRQAARCRTTRRWGSSAGSCSRTTASTSTP